MEKGKEVTPRSDAAALTESQAYNSGLGYGGARDIVPLGFAQRMEKESICLMALVAMLQSNALSGDLWVLCHAGARKMAEEMGVEPEFYDWVETRLEAARINRFKANPMSGMF